MQRSTFLILNLIALTWLSACTPATAPPILPPDTLQEADGGMILQRSCTVCHNLSGLGVYADFWGEAEWRSMVETMVAYGATLTPSEVDVVSAYLAVNFGTAGSATSSTELQDTTRTEMAALLDSACTTCHDLTAITLNPGAFTADEFRQTVERMLLYGAPVREDQVETLVAHLVSTYGD